MRRHFFPILVILLLTITLAANNFHRHGDAASIAKCPICSGKYISAATHTTVAVPAPVFPAKPPQLSAVADHIAPSIALATFLNNRAPPNTSACL